MSLGESLRKIVIFDLDEVLVNKTGKGARVFLNGTAYAVNKVFGVNTDMSMIKLGLEAQMLMDLTRKAGISKARAMRNLDRMLKAKLDYCRRNFSSYTCSAYPGAKRLLNRLVNAQFKIGLATGTPKKVTALKLKKAKIDANIFKFGGYAESITKTGAIRAALKQAESRYGRIKKGRTFFFGDTPLDVRSGKEVGLRTVAVATGHYSMRQLAKEKPDYVLRDLMDTDRIMKIVNS